ncbi:MAG: molybdopterin-dependent oxidoreductase [Chloroflexota bacterium]
MTLRSLALSALDPLLDTYAAVNNRFASLHLYPPKVSVRFQRISWEEAISTIAGRYGEISDRYGAETILRFWHGGTMGLVQRYPMGWRFINWLGAATHTRTICGSASQQGFAYSVGAVRGSDSETIPDSRLVIIWGINAISATPWTQQIGEKQ